MCNRSSPCRSAPATLRFAARIRRESEAGPSRLRSPAGPLLLLRLAKLEKCVSRCRLAKRLGRRGWPCSKQIGQMLRIAWSWQRHHFVAPHPATMTIAGFDAVPIGCDDFDKDV